MVESRYGFLCGWLAADPARCWRGRLGCSTIVQYPHQTRAAVQRCNEYPSIVARIVAHNGASHMPILERKQTPNVAQEETP